MSLIHADVADNLFQRLGAGAFAEHVSRTKPCLGKLAFNTVGDHAADTAEPAAEYASGYR